MWNPYAVVMEMSSKEIIMKLLCGSEDECGSKRKDIL